ncbi:MAG: hypothetical protein IPL36_14295 [Nigerium sp.]|nr:hypothetical protein [Nigerium sp.]
MPSDADRSEEQLRAALKRLCSLGLNTIVRVDPALAAALRVPRDSSPAEAHELTRRSLLAHSDRLSGELRVVFLEACGFRRDSPDSALARVQAAADRLRVSRRTAYRRLDAAIDQIVTMLLKGSEKCIVQDIDYVFLNAHMRVDLAGSYPTIVTERTISARSAGVDHLDERLFFPRLAEGDLNLRALEGCAVEENTFVGAGVWALRVRLPHELKVGEQHAFALSLRLPDHDSLEPFIGFLPYTTSFDATIELRFGDRLPTALEQFVGPPPIPGSPRASDVRPVTPIGRRHTITLPQMRPGLCYGVRWAWADAAPAVPVS